MVTSDPAAAPADRSETVEAVTSASEQVDRGAAFETST